eukprot:tig00001155_g7313.t1
MESCFVAGLGVTAATRPTTAIAARTGRSQPQSRGAAAAAVQKGRQLFFGVQAQSRGAQRFEGRPRFAVHAEAPAESSDAEATDRAKAIGFEEAMQRARTVQEQEFVYVQNDEKGGIGGMSKMGLKGMEGGKFCTLPVYDSKEPKPIEVFYREAVPVHEANQQLPVVLLHGLPSQSYSFRDVLPALARVGHRTIAPDLVGFGFSDKPQDGYGFDYTPKSFLRSLEDFLAAVGVEGQFHLVVQGFLGGPLGMEYAIAHPDRVASLAILNSPLGPSSAKLPGKLAQMALPVVGEFISQDVMSVERTLEAGGPYVIPPEACDVYRRPYLSSSDAGFALLATVRKLDLKSRLARIEKELPSYAGPARLVWGASDKYVPAAALEAFRKSVLPSADLVAIGECGHFPQEDWHEKTSEGLASFYRKKF